MRPIPRAPGVFEGTVEELFERIIKPVAPPIEMVQRFHTLLLEYLKRPDAAFVVRGRSDSRRTELLTARRLRILPSDNSPAWWAHHVCWSGLGFEDGTFPSALEGCPRHFHDASARRANGVNAAGW